MNIPKINCNFNLSKRSKRLLTGAAALAVSTVISGMADVIEDKKNYIAECENYISICENAITNLMNVDIKIYHF